MSCKVQDWKKTVCAVSAPQPLVRGKFHGLNAGLGAVHAITVLQGKGAFYREIAGCLQCEKFIILLFISPNVF